MRFWAALIAVNVACFLPSYLRYFRSAPNPFEFLHNNGKSPYRGLIRRLFARPGYSDPWQINFDFSFVLLVAVGLGMTAAPLRWFIALVLAFSIVQILYNLVMETIFKRPPAILSDISLARAGLGLAQEKRVWIFALLGLALAIIGCVSYLATEWLFDIRPVSGTAPLVVAAILVPPAFYHWRIFSYDEFRNRSVYSATLHMVRNIEYCLVVLKVVRKDRSHFESCNRFSEVRLSNPPNVVMVCVESYGKLAFDDPKIRTSISATLAEHERALSKRGYHFASNFSEPPIFAGGSWLSYTSLTYGFRLKDVLLFDALFTRESEFSSYESMFHVLRRNHYRNVLLCPLGGIDVNTVDWQSIRRCFNAQQILDIGALQYSGPQVNYFGRVRRFAPPDQYSLNFGYDAARTSGNNPFSLFFCTLNSHYPYQSPTIPVSDWRTLNDPQAPLGITQQSTTVSRYRDAIAYQLDYILRFALDKADDELLLIVFGDHQPPFLTPEHMGKHTPVHVIARAPAVLEAFHSNGFTRSLDLSTGSPRAIHHEAFLSLLMSGMNSAYGERSTAKIAFEPSGMALFDI